MEELKEKIEVIFAQAKDQSEILDEIYRLFAPVTKGTVIISQRPFCGQRLYRFIAQKFQAFDYQHHPKAFPAGLWIVHGFRESKHLGDWEVSWPEYRVQSNRSLCFD